MSSPCQYVGEQHDIYPHLPLMSQLNSHYPSTLPQHSHCCSMLLCYSLTHLCQSLTCVMCPPFLIIPQHVSIIACHSLVCLVVLCHHKHALNLNGTSPNQMFPFLNLQGCPIRDILEILGTSMGHPKDVSKERDIINIVFKVL